MLMSVEYYTPKRIIPCFTKRHGRSLEIPDEKNSWTGRWPPVRYEKKKKAKHETKGKKKQKDGKLGRRGMFK